MFTQKWRDHWGLHEDPFSCEDADKDLLLTTLDTAAVHSGFDRIFGNPRVPAPGIAFGEKGSGKSGLRVMMRRRLQDHNEAHPEEKVFLIEYIDFNGFIDNVRKSVGEKADSRRSAQKVVEAWSIADHLDCMLSLGVSKLVGECLDSKERPEKLPRKQRIDLLLLTSLYHDSSRRTTLEAVEGMKSRLRHHSVRPGMLRLLQLVLSVVAIGVAIFPHLIAEADRMGPNKLWYGLGIALLVATWGWGYLSNALVQATARRATKSVRVLPHDPRPLTDVLRGFSPKERKEFVLPAGHEEASRYELLHRFVGLLEALGYHGCYVLMDRIDEPSLISGNDELMRAFVEKILDIKLLQYPQIALKLFLPIELESLYRNASAEELKRMRLDKSNLVPELKWTGQELYEIANQRLLACMASQNGRTLPDLFEEGFDFEHLKDTLTSLGTPRYAFGFLSAAFLEYVKDLPNDLGDDDPRWRLPRSHFDVVRAGWIDRTGILRRTLN